MLAEDQRLCSIKFLFSRSWHTWRYSIIVFVLKPRPQYPQPTWPPTFWQPNLSWQEGWKIVLSGIYKPRLSPKGTDNHDFPNESHQTTAQWSPMLTNTLLELPYQIANSLLLTIRKPKMNRYPRTAIIMDHRYPKQISAIWKKENSKRKHWCRPGLPDGHKGLVDRSRKPLHSISIPGWGGLSYAFLWGIFCCIIGTGWVQIPRGIKPSAVFYTLGNIARSTSKCLLMGPMEKQRQCLRRKAACNNGYASVSNIHVLCSLWWHRRRLALFLCILQLSSKIVHSLLRIPYASGAVIKCSFLLSREWETPEKNMWKLMFNFWWSMLLPVQ